jgi:hypothetical protein
MRAWPSAIQEEDEGWVLRLDVGYTGRANSVTVLRHDPRHAAEALAARIRRCEARYLTARQNV